MSIFYLIFIALTAYFSFQYDHIEEYDAHKQHRLWLMCFYLICLAGFSYGLGADKFTYMEEFEYYPDSLSELGDYIQFNIMFRGEMPLWTVVNAVCKVVFNSFYAVQLLESAAINIAVCYMVSRYTHRCFLFLLIYFFTLQYFVFNTEVMREGFALSFILYGIDGYLSGKKWLYFVMLPIALMFHVSAAISLLILFSRFSISWKTLAYAFILAFSLWLFGDLMLQKVVAAALGGMGAFVMKVMLYSFQATNLFGFFRFALTYLVFPFIIMYTVLLMEPSEELRMKKERIMAFMVLLGIIASSMVGFIRFYNYVQIFYLIALADFVYILFRIKEHLIIRLGTLAGTVLFIALIYLNYYNSTNTYFYHFFYPYTCILNEDKSVYFREIAHKEALELDVKDDNVRDID
ncbi:MAG: EpsG family protein [Prevotella sp.]|nr:EpsG family protein [Prevotella sp.]